LQFSPVPAGPPNERAVALPHDADALTWSYRIPLINNRFILWDYFRALAATFAIVIAIILGLVIFTEDVRLRDLAGMELVLPGVFGVFLIVSLIAALILGNHFNATFTLDKDGVVFETGGRERTIGRLGLVLAILSGRPGLAGAGLVAASREVERHAWNEVRRVRVYRGPRVVCLSDSWHCFMRLYCPPDLFDEVVQRVERCTAHLRTS
jgi:hypothetical protein